MSMTLLQSYELYSSPEESRSQKELYGDMTEALSSTIVPGKKKKKKQLTDVLQKYKHQSLQLKSQHENPQLRINSSIFI